MIALRAFDARDLAALLAINAASQPHVAALDAREVQRLLSLGATILVAEHEPDRIAAYLIAVDSRCDYDGEEFSALRMRFDDGFLYVDQIAVASDARRLGIARQMYAAAAARAAHDGKPRLCCEVNTRPPNPDSLAFHLGIGFEVIAPFEVSDGRAVALLARVGATCVGAGCVGAA